MQRIDLDGKVTGVFADYHYVGTGDIGGATDEATVKLLEAIVTKSETCCRLRRLRFSVAAGLNSPALQPGPPCRWATVRCT